MSLKRVSTEKLKRIYLDNQTITAPSARSVAAMQPYLTQKWGTPTAPHETGQQLLPAMREAYSRIYELLGAADEDTVIFTSSGAEAVNHLVLATYLDLTRETGLNHFVTSNCDEAPVIMAMERLEHLGCSTTLVPVNKEGIVTPEALGDHFTPRTALVSMSWANGLTGVVQPVSDLAQVCRERGILFHLEASHVLGKIDFDLSEISPDLVSFGGHLIHAPAGTGALWIRSGLEISPLIVGGHEQAGYRGGVFSVAGLVALGVAAQEAAEGRDLMGTEVTRLRDRLEAGLIQAGGQRLMEDGERLPTICLLAFPGVASDALLYRLDQEGLSASFGGGVYQQLSVQLAAYDIKGPLTECAVSFSLSRETSESEVDRAIEIIGRTVRQLQKLSNGIPWERVN
jgi:cysteine desulfurase